MRQHSEYAFQSIDGEHHELCNENRKKMNVGLHHKSKNAHIIWESEARARLL